jgi:hypothetical protein
MTYRLTKYKLTRAVIACTGPRRVSVVSTPETATIKGPWRLLDRRHGMHASHSLTKLCFNATADPKFSRLVQRVAPHDLGGQNHMIRI